MSVHDGSGPWFEELAVGRTYSASPAITLTEGRIALRQAIVGDRFKLALDAHLSRRITGSQVVSPGMVWDVAIGQSTEVTREVVANLFYRGLAIRRMPHVGDTLATSTTVIALKQNTPRDGRQLTGLALLRIHTVDQLGRDVLDFERCAMIPLGEDNPTSHQDDISGTAALPSTEALAELVSEWDLAQFRSTVHGAHASTVGAGQKFVSGGADVIAAAPELARLTVNQARVHLEGSPPGNRLVYGGHTIGVALGQVLRVIPNLATVLAWHSCDHLGPVREGDLLRSEIEVEAADTFGDGHALVHLRVLSEAGAPDGSPFAPVLDWRFIGVMA